MASKIGDLLNNVNISNTRVVRNYIYEGTCYGWFHKYQQVIIASLCILICLFFFGAIGVIYVQNGNIYARDCWPNECPTSTSQSTSVSIGDYVYEDYNWEKDPNNYYQNLPEVDESWSFRFPTPTNRNLLSIAYGSAGFVAIGVDNTILTSNDGKIWNFQPPFLNYNITFETISFGAGVYWLQGNNGLSWISSDAQDWFPSDYSFPKGIVSGNGVYLGINDNKLYIHDVNSDWSPIYEPWSEIKVDGATYYSSVVFANGFFTLLGAIDASKLNIQSPNSSFQCIWKSTNGIFWNFINIFDEVNTNAIGELESMNLIFIPGNIVKVENYFDDYENQNYQGIYLLFRGEVFSSPDTILWEHVDSPWNLIFYPSDTSCIYNGFCISIAGSTSISQTMLAYSLNFGINWEYQYLDGVYNQLDNFDGSFVLVGDGGIIFNLNASFSDYYDINVEWSSTGAQSSLELNNVIFGDGIFTSIAYDQTNRTFFNVHSIDGLHWNVDALNVPINTEDIAFGNGVYITALAVDGSLIIYNSTNSIGDWRFSAQIEGNFTISHLSFQSFQFLLSLVVLNNSLPSSSVIYTSTDGLTWELHETTFVEFDRPIFINQVVWNPFVYEYFGLSSTGYIWSSTNLNNWRLIYSTGVCNSIAVNTNDGFVFAVCLPNSQSYYAVVGGKYGGSWYNFYTFNSNIKGTIKYYYIDNTFFIAADFIIKSTDSFKSVHKYVYPIEITSISSFAVGNDVLTIASNSAIISSKISAL